MPKTTRQLRASFDISPRDLEGYRSYDVRCLHPDCGWEAKAWDWRRNALAAGYQHALDHDDPIELILPDTLKALRETLAEAETYFANWAASYIDNPEEHLARVQRILAEVDRLIEERY